MKLSHVVMKMIYHGYLVVQMLMEFNPIATIDDGSCATAVVFGCTDTGACNYSSSANTDDGSTIRL